MLKTNNDITIFDLNLLINDIEIFNIIKFINLLRIFSLELENKISDQGEQTNY